MFLISTIQEALQTLYGKRPLLGFLVLFWSLSIPFEEHIPAYGFLIFLMTAFMLGVSSLSLQSRNNLWIAGMAAGAFVLYGAYLFSTRYLWIDSLENISLGLLVLAVLKYYCWPEDFIGECIGRLRQTLIAAGYFLTLVVMAYIIFYFLGLILNINLFTNAWLFRAILAVSSYIAWATFFAYTYQPLTVPGKFFYTLFARIVPIGMFIAFVLAAIYLIQVLLGYRDDIPLLYVYYPGVVWCFLFYLLGTYCGLSQQVQQRLTWVFILLTVLVFAILIKRFLYLPAYQVNFIYPFLANSFFLWYLLDLLYKQRGFSYRFFYLGIAIIALVFTPFIGYQAYQSITHYTMHSDGVAKASHYDIRHAWEKRETSAWERHHGAKARRMQSDDEQPQQDGAEKSKIVTDKPSLNFEAQHYKDAFVNGENITFQRLYLDQQLHWNGAKERVYTLPDGKVLKITAVEEGQKLQVEVGSETQIFNILDAFSAYKAQAKESGTLAFPKFEGNSFILYFTNYHLGNVKSDEKQRFSMEYLLLIK